MRKYCDKYCTNINTEILTTQLNCTRLGLKQLITVCHKGSNLGQFGIRVPNISPGTYPEGNPQYLTFVFVHGKVTHNDGFRLNIALKRLLFGLLQTVSERLSEYLSFDVIDCPTHRLAPCRHIPNVSASPALSQQTGTFSKHALPSLLIIASARPPPCLSTSRRRHGCLDDVASCR